MDVVVEVVLVFVFLVAAAAAAWIVGVKLEVEVVVEVAVEVPNKAVINCGCATERVAKESRKRNVVSMIGSIQVLNERLD